MNGYINLKTNRHPEWFDSPPTTAKLQCKNKNSRHLSKVFYHYFPNYYFLALTDYFIYSCVVGCGIDGETSEAADAEYAYAVGIHIRLNRKEINGSREVLGVDVGRGHAARELLNDLSLSVTQVGDRLGFEYPQHFVRFFKRRTGRTPREYRTVSLS